MSSFFERIKEELMQKKIFNTVQKLAFSIDANHQKTKQDLILIKSIVNNICFNSSSILFPFNLFGNRNNASILQKSIL